MANALPFRLVKPCFSQRISPMNGAKIGESRQKTKESLIFVKGDG